MPLTDKEIRNSRSTLKARKLYDKDGLYLEIAPAGGRWWRLKYRFGGKEKRLSLGVYPAVTLQDARIACAQMKAMLRAGTDPGEVRRFKKSIQADRLANTFEIVAREWFFKQSTIWTPAHYSRVVRRFERDLFPSLGARPIAEISAPELLAVLRRIESRGVSETTRRALGDCGMVFRFAVATGRAAIDPSGALRGALRPVKAAHFAAQTDPSEVAKILQKLDGYSGTPTVRAALRLQPMLFCRPGELRRAEWGDFDLDAGEWRFLASKTRTAHIVPLSRQAQTILRDLRLVTGRSRFVFPSNARPERPMSDAATLVAMRRLGIGQDVQTGHGWRATARTLLDEELKFPPHLIEHQLAHAVRDPNGRAYNRTSFLAERKAMMQTWSDYLDELKSCPQI